MDVSPFTVHHSGGRHYEIIEWGDDTNEYVVADALTYREAVVMAEQRNDEYNANADWPRSI